MRRPKSDAGEDVLQASAAAVPAWSLFTEYRVQTLSAPLFSPSLPFRLSLHAAEAAVNAMQGGY